MGAVGSGARKQNDAVDQRTAGGCAAAETVPFETELVATIGGMANKYEVSDSRRGWNDIRESVVFDDGLFATLANGEVNIPMRCVKRIWQTLNFSDLQCAGLLECPGFRVIDERQWST